MDPEGAEGRAGDQVRAGSHGGLVVGHLPSLTDAGGLCGGIQPPKALICPDSQSTAKQALQE